VKRLYSRKIGSKERLFRAPGSGHRDGEGHLSKTGCNPLLGSLGTSNRVLKEVTGRDNKKKSRREGKLIEKGNQWRG